MATPRYCNRHLDFLPPPHLLLSCLINRGDKQRSLWRGQRGPGTHRRKLPLVKAHGRVSRLSSVAGQRRSPYVGPRRWRSSHPWECEGFLLIASEQPVFLNETFEAKAAHARTRLSPKSETFPQTSSRANGHGGLMHERWIRCERWDLQIDGRTLLALRALAGPSHPSCDCTAGKSCCFVATADQVINTAALPMLGVVT